MSELKLTETDAKEFIPGIHVMLEASFARWRVVPFDGTARILSRNLKLMARCLHTPAQRKIFEDAMNYTGLDHFIGVDSLDKIDFDDDLQHD